MERSVVYYSSQLNKISKTKALAPALLYAFVQDALGSSQHAH